MLVPISALNDNYIWLYKRVNSPAIVIDLSETSQLFQFLCEEELEVEAVFLTHYHDDHTQGVNEFRRVFPHVPIFAPEECDDKGATNILPYLAQTIHTEHYQVKVLPSGGHTSQHLSYLVDGVLFCGDALFSGGCGRVFTGDYELAFESIQQFNALPNDTLICPAHEYTLGNLTFAETVLPSTQAFIEYKTLVEQLRRENRPSLPSRLSLEKQINPFLKAANLDEFIALREAKDLF